MYFANYLISFFIIILYLFFFLLYIIRENSPVYNIGKVRDLKFKNLEYGNAKKIIQIRKGNRIINLYNIYRN
jgi:hypothetical protein